MIGLSYRVGDLAWILLSWAPESSNLGNFQLNYLHSSNVNFCHSVFHFCHSSVQGIDLSLCLDLYFSND